MNLLDPESIPAEDRGLLLGDGLFETIRLYAGRPFRLDRHLERLREGGRRLGIPVPADLVGRVEGALREWGAKEGALRITLTRGSGSGLHPPEVAEGRLLLSVRPLPAGGGSEIPALRARLFGRVDEGALISGLKSLGYLERIQALRLAQEGGCEEALLRNTTGRIVEGAASNLFALLGGALHAPGPAEGALPGITREVLLAEAVAAGFEVRERGIAPEELPAVSELILTSSLRGVAAVVEVEGRPVGAGVPGPCCLELAGSFREVVRREVGV